MAYDPHLPAVAVEPELVARREFATVRQGFDPVEVRAYLADVSRELQLARERELQHQLHIADLERQLADTTERLRRFEEQSAVPSDAAEPGAILDESQLTSVLGEETARILETARLAATNLRARAEEHAHRARTRAAELLEQARMDAESLIASAREQAAAEARAQRQAADAEIAELRLAAAAEIEEAQAEATAIVDAARAEAHALRQRLLTELAERRRALRGQVEQLNAARERLLDALAAVTGLTAAATAELEVALPDARRAARAALARTLPPDDGDREIAAAMGATAEQDAATSEMSADGDEQSGVDGHALADPTSDSASTEASADQSASRLPAADEPDELHLPAADAASASSLPSGPDASESGQPRTEAGERPWVGEPGLFARLRQEAAGSAPGHRDQTRHGSAGRGAKARPRAEGEPAEHEAAERQAVATRGAEPYLEPDPERALRELERELHRQLDRALVEEQEQLLDALRRQKQRPRPGELLADTHERRERYLDAALAVLPRAAELGARVALDGHRDQAGPAVVSATADPRAEPLVRIPSVGDLADAVSTALVEGLELAVDAALAGGGGQGKGRFDPAPLFETARAGFQQVRDTVVDPVARRAARAAFERGLADNSSV